MSRTRHHSSRHGEPLDGYGDKRKACGYEYWGKDAESGSDGEKIRRNRRRQRKLDERRREYEDGS